MATHRDLLLTLREGFEVLEPLDNTRLKSLNNRGQMLIRRIFDENSVYLEQLNKVKFHYRGPMVIGGPPSAEEQAGRRRIWESGRKEAIALVDTMIEDLELGEPGQASSEEDPSTPISNQVFVVHGHDDEMKLAVARTVEQLGLDPVILHEKPNRSQTIIEKIERYSNSGFAVVLLSPDDIGYANEKEQEAAKPRARQNVILELGYFAGKLGREKVVALYRGNVELPSDYDGVLYTRYDGASGTWRNALVAELKESGYNVSADDL